MAITGDGRNWSQTPSMGLRLPVPGVCGPLGVEPPGLSHDELRNQNFFTLDTHTHAPGFGSQVPSSGLNINADLSFGGFNATNLRSTRYSPLPLGLSSLGVPDVGCLVVVTPDLFYVDTSANRIRLTQGGAVAGTPGSITGLVAPAAVTYTPGSKLFTFLSSVPRVASLSCGPLSIGDATVDNGRQLTLSVPSGMLGSFGLTLPGALPVTQGLIQVTPAGAMSYFGITDNFNNLTIAGNLSSSIAAQWLISATSAGAQLQLRGNQLAGAAGADVLTNTAVTRTAGQLFQVNNNGVFELGVDFVGNIIWPSYTPTTVAGPTAPTAPTVNAGWTAQEGLAYWKDPVGMVHVKGSAFEGVGATTVIFALPVGFRPAFGRRFPVINQSTGTTLQILIDTVGGINVFGGSTPQTVNFDGIAFLAEA